MVKAAARREFTGRNGGGRGRRRGEIDRDRPVRAEVLGWKGEAGEKPLHDLVGRIAQEHERRRNKLFNTLRGLLPSAKWRDVADEVWHCALPDTQYIFDTEDDLVDAFNAKYAIIKRKGSWEFVSWEDDGEPVFSKKRDMEIAAAQYRWRVVTKKKDKEGNVIKDKDGNDVKDVKELLRFFPVLAQAIRVEKYIAGFGFYPDVSKCPYGFLNMWTGFAIEPAPGGLVILGLKRAPAE